MIESESKRKFRVMRGQTYRMASDVELEGTLSSSEHEHDIANSVTARWEDVQELMMPVVIPMQEQIDFLESQVSILTKKLNILQEEKGQKNIQQLKEQSKKTAIELREMFNLQEIDNEDEKISLSDMNGMFKEYGDKKIDSVELLRSMRDEED